MLIEHLPGEPTSFNVIPYDDPHPSQIKLTARNRDQKRQWAQHIKQVMLEHFDIPNRAKELVFKLGDEEGNKTPKRSPSTIENNEILVPPFLVFQTDRTPDKNTWKWGANSSSTTPEYLERRNQYRRSEMRYRTKKQRKTITTSISMEGFDKKSYSPLALRKTTESPQQSTAPPSPKLIQPKSVCNHNSDNCQCKIVQDELSNTLTRHNLLKSKEGRGRSKSEPRISPPNGADVNGTQTEFKSFDGAESMGRMSPKTRASTESIYKSMSLTRGTSAKDRAHEIKVYNTKTLPKRIVNLRKQRNKTTKETFKFYMDLPADAVDNTVLRITESSDNLHEDKADATPNDIEIAEEADETVGLKRDVEIISDLLKEKNRDIERILNKPPKKKSFDNGRISGEASHELTITPADVPTDDAPVDHDTTMRLTENLISRLATIQKEIHIPEPIYESLLRNVHVPYKYSPVLGRSKLYKLAALSQQIDAATAATEPSAVDHAIEHAAQEPESDYVTLVFSESGQLESVDSTTTTIVSHVKDEVSLFRNSDSNINYNKLGRTDEDSDLSTGVLDRRSSFNLKSSMNLIQRLISIKAEAAMISGNEMGSTDSGIVSRTGSNKKMAAADNVSLKSTRMPERRTSDVTEMCRIHKQGSETLGSRIAQLDYADPKTLFTVPSQTNILINKAAVKSQRDSVFSLTSSNDSVNDAKQQQQHDESKTMTAADDDYEKNVEDSLENGVFRDSAIYSDDNEQRRGENIYESPTLLMFADDCEAAEKTPITPPTPPPRNCPPKVPKKPTLIGGTRCQPPPLPAKPVIYATIGSPTKAEPKSAGELIGNGTASIKDDGGGGGKSWVTQQIKNFEK